MRASCKEKNIHLKVMTNYFVNSIFNLIQNYNNINLTSKLQKYNQKFS